MTLQVSTTLAGRLDASPVAWFVLVNPACPVYRRLAGW